MTDQIVPNEVRAQRDARPAFLYSHVVSFEDTNLVGNVYFARHLSWQGRCREMFLRTHAPSVLRELGEDLRLVTLRVSCDYFEEFQAFDTVDIELRLAHQEQHRIGLDFEYWLRREDQDRRLAAAGFQETGCLRIGAQGAIPVPPPKDLLQALKKFRPMARAVSATEAAGV